MLYVKLREGKVAEKALASASTLNTSSLNSHLIELVKELGISSINPHIIDDVKKEMIAICEKGCWTPY